MLRLSVCLTAFACAVPVHADRFSDMSTTERCVYEARLAVAAYHHFLQGRKREQVRIYWHGDETESEIVFVDRLVAQAYARGEAVRGSGQQLSEQAFGDQAYDACMNGRDS